MGLFVLYISDPVGRNFARYVHTRIQKVFIRKLPLRFYAKSKFCVCFEVHIPVTVQLEVFGMQRSSRMTNFLRTLSKSLCKIS